MAEPAPTTTAIDKETGLYYGRNPKTGLVEQVGPEAFQKYGYKPVGEPEAVQHKTVEKRAGKASLIDAVGLGSARGLFNTVTGGLGDLDSFVTGRGIDIDPNATPEERAALRERWARDAQLIEEQHPLAAAGSEIVTNIAGLVLTGGGIPGAVVKRLSPAHVAGVPRAALTGAAEAAFYGPASAGREASVKNTELTSDLLFAHTSGLAGLGGLIGAGGGALARARAGKALEKSERALRSEGPMTASDMLAHAKAQFGDDIHPTLTDVLGAAGTGSEAEVVALLKRNPTARQLARPGAIEELTDTMAVGLADDASRLAEVGEAARAHSGRLKYDSVLKNTDGTYLPQASIAAEESLEAIRARTIAALEDPAYKAAYAGAKPDAVEMGGLIERREILQDAIRDAEKAEAKALQGELKDVEGRIAAFGKMGVVAPATPPGFLALRRTLGAVNEAEARIARRMAKEGASDSDRVATIFTELDRLKRRTSSLAEGGKAAGEWGDSALAMRDVHDGILRDVLQNEQVFGKRLAAMQTEINAPYHNMLNHLTATAGGYLKKSGQVSNYSPWHQKLSGDPDKFLSLLGKIDRPLRNEEVASLKQWAQSNLEMSQVMRDKYALTKEELKRLGESDKAAHSFLERLDNGAQLMSLASQIERVVGGSVVPRAALHTAGAVAGGVLGGPPGAAAGVAIADGLSRILSPGYKIKALAGIEAMRQTHDSWVLKMIHRVLGGRELPKRSVAEIADPIAATMAKTKPVLAPVEAPAPKRLRSQTVNAVLYKWFASSDAPKDRARALVNAGEAFRAAAANPEAIREGVRQQLGQTADDYPEVTDALATKTQRAAQILADKFPQMPFSLWQEEPPQLGLADRVRFEGLVEAAFDPLAALSRATEGLLTPEQVDLLDELHPGLMVDLRTRFVESLDSSKPPAMVVRRQLAILLRIPADPTLTPEYVQGMQEVHAAKAALADESSQAASRRTYNPTGVNISDVYSDRILRLQRGEAPR